MKPLLTIWVWKAKSVEQARQRSVAGCVRERRRAPVGGFGGVGVAGELPLALVGETEEKGELEREGITIPLSGVGSGDDAVGGEGDGSVARRRRKGMRMVGRR